MIVRPRELSPMPDLCNRPFRRNFPQQSLNNLRSMLLVDLAHAREPMMRALFALELFRLSPGNV